MAGEELRELILHEFTNIVEGVSDEEFYESLKKKEHNINWMKIVGTLKKEILNDISQELNDMWKQENLSEKIDTLNKIKENAPSVNKESWRPKTGNIDSQTATLNMHLLKDLKNRYIAIGDREEEKVAKLKNELIKEWDDLKQHQKNVQLAESKISIINQNIENTLKSNRDTLDNLFDKFEQ